MLPVEIAYQNGDVIYAHLFKADPQTSDANIGITSPGTQGTHGLGNLDQSIRLGSGSQRD